MSERITRVANDGLIFDVRDEGPLGGTPTVLLHGFPERSTSWRHVAPVLHDAGLRTYALDQRGYSPGARPCRRRDYRISRIVGDVVALVEEVGAPVHLVGHDWGAVASWLTAAQRPDLLQSLTAISVPHPTAFVAAGLTSGQALRSWYVGLFQLPRVAELAAATGQLQRGLRRSGMTEDEVARFQREIVDDGALPHALGWYRALPLLDRSLGDRRVGVPTTLLWSDGDTAVARRGVEESRRWVDAPYELVVLRGVTHWIPTQAPEACAAAILARVGVAA
jgi:pimeloyl-ACP methyl ester carboxylesterase